MPGNRCADARRLMASKWCGADLGIRQRAGRPGGDHQAVWEIVGDMVNVAGRAVPVIHMYDLDERLQALVARNYPVADALSRAWCSTPRAARAATACCWMWAFPSGRSATRWTSNPRPAMARCDGWTTSITRRCRRCCCPMAAKTAPRAGCRPWTLPATGRLTAVPSSWATTCRPTCAAWVGVRRSLLELVPRHRYLKFVQSRLSGWVGRIAAGDRARAASPLCGMAGLGAAR